MNMVKAVLGKKICMTQLFDEAGNLVPVTVLKVGPCSVVQLKTDSTGACRAVQIGFDERKKKNTPAPLLGHFAKAGVAPVKVLRDVEPDGNAELKPGQTIGVDVFEGTSLVDVSSKSKGRGFAGVIKRHHFAGGPATHGSKTHRRPGSIGSSTSPGRVVKGKRMPGHMGNAQVTIRNLRVIKLDRDKNLMLVKGAVPGSRGSYVLVRKAKTPHGRQ
jgi:large subunit ribosomal protein L3